MVFGESITFDDGGIDGAVLPPVLPAASRSDESALVQRLRAGEEEAFETLVDLYSGDVFNLLCRLTENIEESQDLLQDTFLAAVRSIRNFRGESGLKTWLYRIAINESRNRFRWWKRRRREVTISLDATIGGSEMTVSETLSDKAPLPDDLALAAEREYALKAALLDLPDAFREAVVLCDIEGFSYDEAAFALGIKIGTLKSRISRGREDLRRRLKDF